MKKVISILMAIMMVFSVCMLFAGCSSTKNTEEASTNDAAAAGASSGMTATEGVLVMATNAAFPPYEYKDGDSIVGIDAEIAQAIAEKLGLTLQIVDIDFDSVLTGVQSGKYDMGMAGITVTPDREKNASFTQSYAKGVQSVIVTEDSAITTLDDIKSDGSMKIGVQQSTTGDIYASDSVDNGGYGEDNVIRYKTGADAVQALVAGKVQAVIIDNEPAKAYVAANDGLKILDTTYADEDYAIYIEKENTELLDSINSAIDELKADGTIQSIIDKYISSEESSSTAA